MSADQNLSRSVVLIVSGAVAQARGEFDELESRHGKSETRRRLVAWLTRSRSRVAQLIAVCEWLGKKYGGKAVLDVRAVELACHLFPQ